MAIPITPRSRCSGQRMRRMEAKPPRQATYTHTSGSEDSERSAATCIGGNSAASSFIIVSMTENAATASSIAWMLRRLPFRRAVASTCMLAGPKKSAELLEHLLGRRDREAAAVLEVQLLDHAVPDQHRVA